MPSDIRLELPPDRGVSALADWVEAWMIVTETGVASEEDIGRQLRSDGDELDDIADPGYDAEGFADEELSAGAGDWRGADEAARQVAETVILEIGRREREAREACGAAQVYPFRRTGDVIEHLETPHGQIYEFLLWLSITNTPFRTTTWGNRATRLFDWLGAAVLRAWLGPSSQAIRFGWPAGVDPVSVDTQAAGIAWAW